MNIIKFSKKIPFCLPFGLCFQLPTLLFELRRYKTAQQVRKADDSALSKAKSSLKREPLHYLPARALQWQAGQ